MDDESEHGGQKAIYHICVLGVLDESWSRWFDGMEVTIARQSDASLLTVLTGPVDDQAALRGILARIWDLNLTLISVNRLDSDVKHIESPGLDVNEVCSDDPD